MDLDKGQDGDFLTMDTFHNCEQERVIEMCQIGNEDWQEDKESLFQELANRLL